MSRSRRLFLNLIFIGFMAGSTYDIVRNEEHWPFSQYPMFSGVWRSPTFTWHRLFGVTADGREVPIDDNRFITPFDQSRLAKALRRIEAQPQGSRLVEPAIADNLRRYEQLRVAGKHHGPRLIAMRLYEVEWTIDPAAANYHSPDRRAFIAEVRAQ